MRAGWLLTAAICLLAVNERSFVDSAPLARSQEADESGGQLQDANVRELESLKHSLGKTLAMMKTQSSEYTADSGGQQEMHADTKEELNADGKVVARVGQQVDSISTAGAETPVTRVRTEVDIPSQGVSRSIVQEDGRDPVITDNGGRRSLPSDQDLNNNLNKYSSYSGVQYSPLDMAEYVFWTGDERGVTMAIEEFLQEGLMSREEAITFLQEIKYNLDYLQTHYANQALRPQEHSKDTANAIQKYMNMNKFQNPLRREDNRPAYDLIDLRQDMSKKGDDSADLEVKREQSLEDDDYEELLEKLRVADFLYTEYSLEEVIYQLSKIMFAQSLTRGSTEAQTALQKFTNFLETEAEEGHISRALEKKVLDVLIAALTDTLTEHPELVPVAREGLGGATHALPDGNRLIRKLLEMGQLDKAAVKAVLAPYKVHQQNDASTNHQEVVNQPKLPPMGLGKYKTP